MTALTYYHIRVIVIFAILSIFQGKLFAQLATDFSATPVSGCTPMVIQFTDLSKGNPIQWRWDLGNGVISSLKNPSATYFTPGAYTIKLVIKNASGSDSITKQKYIVVHPNPVVDFTISDSAGCFPLNVIFTNKTTTSSGTITKYSWDFGDGTTSEIANPTHTYSLAGNFSVTLRITNSFGCVQTISKNKLINTSSGVKADFTNSNPGICASPVSIKFSNTSMGTGILNYKWNFGDGSSSTLKDPQHTYTKAGTYTVSLITSSSLGCTDTIIKENLVSIGTVNSSFANSETICEGRAVQFNNTSLPIPGSSTWYFGDGTTSTVINPIKTFAAAGTYNIKLVNDFGGCIDSISKTVIVKPKPLTNFNANKTSGCQVPLTVNFSHASTGAQTYFWSFGDGNTSSTPNPIHTYTKTGNFTVRLISTNTNGCSDTVTKAQYIKIQEPTIVLNNLPAQGCIPVTIKPSATITANESIATYLWNFGDGNTSTAIKPTHSYTTAGTYDVSLTITTGTGCTKTTTFKEAVRAGKKPGANFSVGSSDVCAFQAINFSDKSTGEPDQWLWDFGDGTTDVAQNPVHEYQDTGWFDVRLISWNNTCADTIILKKVVYIKPPIASFSFTQNCSEKFTVDFKDQSLGALTYQWFFGDEQSSTEVNPKHQYANPGNYEVILSITNGSCTHSTRQTLHVMNEKANFSADATEVCKGTTINFAAVNINADNIATWSWDFGDGTHSETSGNASHKFVKPGTYDVTLTITDLLGCVDTYSLPVNVFGPTAEFEPSVAGACLGTTGIMFTDLSSSDGNHAITKWNWNYGDGTIDSNGVQPFNHFYQQAGEYKVSLTVTDSYGCTDMISKSKAVIIAKPRADFISADSVSCTDKPIQFTNLSTGYDLKYHWQFGDGATADNANAEHIYNKIGSYDIRLMITDMYGCVDFVQKPAYVQISYPKASFTISDTLSSCPPLLVNFKNTSENYTYLKWDFGDGNSSEMPDPSHYYTIPGNYLSTLTAAGPGGCMDVSTQRIEVRGPRGTFSYQPPVGCKPLTVKFIASTHNRSSFIWDFSDGNTLATTDSVVSHTYTIPGNYLPKMILIDPTGCSVPIVGTDTIRVMDVTAGFEMDKNILCDEGNVQFINTTETNDLIKTFHWDFGDGTQSDQRNPIHNFIAPGNYNISLKVTTLNGCTDQVILKDTVRVYASPLIELPVDTSACMPATVQWIAKVKRGDTTSHDWQWNFGNGEIFSGQHPPIKSYTASGTFNVLATVVDEKGCTDSAASLLTIFPLPQVNAGTDGFVCLGDSVQLKPTGAITYHWKASGDLGCTSCTEPFAKPVQNNTYYVTGINEFGCTNMDSLKLRVRQPQSLTVSPGDSICAGQSIQLFAFGADQYNWSPSEGLNKYNIADPVARPVKTIEYRVIGTDDDHCFNDTASILIHVTPLPVVDAGKDATISAGSAHQLKPTYSPDVISWKWTPAAFVNCATCPEPFANPRETTRYFLEVKNSAGCVWIDDVTINVTCNNGNLFIPNSFSPNSDGANDIFYPRGSGVSNIKALRVFNRWGELVFERLNFRTNDAGAGWDGTFKGKQLNPDVYVYACEVVCDNNEVLVFKGDISLLK
ncbi:MAG: PKD domain-containing protein [Chitinophagaceae bacterium]|nr:PKD domain-containing protein [Chitinophagaceae bacterium]